MKIDFQKLARIEERSRQRHVVLTDIGRRLDNARQEWHRSRTSFIEQVAKNPFTATLYDALTRDFSLAAIKGHRNEADLTPGIKAINTLKAEVDRLAAEQAQAQGRWETANACLNVLREFAQKYGKAGTSTVPVGTVLHGG